MTTASTNTVVNHTSTAGFRVWVAEVIAQLIAVGATQTADTGQINTATVNRPAVNTSGGYAIFRFNDTAHATTPIFMRIEFGTASTADYPMMWITVGQSTSGAGVITGSLIMTRVAVCVDTPPTSTAAAYVSRFCYNATQGVLWMGWKIGSHGTNQCMGGFTVYRGTNASGAPTTESIILITNSATDTGLTGNAGFAQVISTSASVVYNTAPFPSSAWAFNPFVIAGTLVGLNVQVIPVYQYLPTLGISASMGLMFIAELAVGSTIATLALVGATTHTFVQAGSFWGGSAIAGTALGPSSIGALMLWE